MNPAIVATLIVAGTGLLIGILLGIAGEALKVPVNEKEERIKEALPGVNCGACGYPGCDGLAAAVAEGLAPVNACLVGAEPVAAKLAAIMGVDVGNAEKQVAYVHCAGYKEDVKERYVYNGLMDCRSAMVAPGKGPRGCTYGCMGYGSCVNVCDYDSIHIQNGIAVVDEEKCVACKKCIDICPQNLIDLIPYRAKVRVRCVSQDKGKDVKAVCQVGCIGCTLCTKVCEDDAIHMHGNVAVIDQSKCTACEKCVVKCPTKVIRVQINQGVREVVVG